MCQRSISTIDFLFDFWRQNVQKERTESVQVRRWSCWKESNADERKAGRSSWGLSSCRRGRKAMLGNRCTGDDSPACKNCWGDRDHHYWQISFMWFYVFVLGCFVWSLWTICSNVLDAIISVDARHLLFVCLGTCNRLSLTLMYRLSGAIK